MDFRISFPFVPFLKIFVSFVVKFFFILLSFFSSAASAQGTKISEIITSIAEELAAEESDPEAVELYVDRLSDLAEDPVRINSADEESISRLFFLTDFQKRSLVDYSHSSGMIFSIYEIANIPGFNLETAEMILPFVIIDETGKNPVVRKHISQSLLSNFIFPSSIDTTNVGSPLRILSKYKFSATSFIGGFTIEKDPGEQFLTGNPAMPDFFSAYLAYSGKGFVRKIIIGDFSAKFGQGACINTGFSPGLQLTSAGFMSFRDEIRQYSSSNENGFFRGAAASFAHRNLGLSLFYSQNNEDATLDATKNYIETFYVSGIHNSTSTILRKNVFTVNSLGLNLTSDFKNVRVGMVYTEDRLSLPVLRNSPSPEDIYDFSGDRNTLYSLYYRSLTGRILLFGELTLNSEFNHALVQGASLRLSDRLTVNALYRNFDRDFSTLHGKGPGGNTVNERSILGNFVFEAARNLFVSAGCDLRYYPWLKYRSSAPSYGVRAEARTKYFLSETMYLEGQYRYRSSMTDETRLQGIPQQEQSISESFRFIFRYSPNEHLTLTTRLDLTQARPSNEKGSMLSQDMSYSMSKFPLSFWLRYSIFRTDGWNSRIYSYENDLLYSFNIPALSGVGSRSYLMIKYDLGDFADIRLKYGVKSIDELNAQNFKVQVRLLF